MSDEGTLNKFCCAETGGSKRKNAKHSISSREAPSTSFVFMIFEIIGKRTKPGARVNPITPKFLPQIYWAQCAWQANRLIYSRQCDPRNKKKIQRGIRPSSKRGFQKD